MVAVMSAHDDRVYDDIIVVGGGCYGSYYVTQLLKARAASALHFRQVIVVDHDAGCAVARQHVGSEVVTVEVSEWSAYFDRYLSAQPPSTNDAIVPSPLMPHHVSMVAATRGCAVARAHGRNAPPPRGA
jgi:threonine dehydrogenase-like Zn-dependent dehydrogenase